MINSSFMYTLSDNCILRIGPHGQVVSKFGREVEETSDMQVDLRMSLISYGSTMDLTEYFRYFHVVATSAARRLASEEFMRGNFVAMLDNGYVPFYMPPTYMPDTLAKSFKELIKQTGIRYIENKALRFDGVDVGSVSNDIWISRPDAADYLDIDLSTFKTLNFIKEVWSRASDRLR